MHLNVRVNDLNNVLAATGWLNGHTTRFARDAHVAERRQAPSARSRHASSSTPVDVTDIPNGMRERGDALPT